MVGLCVCGKKQRGCLDCTPNCTKCQVNPRDHAAKYRCRACRNIYDAALARRKYAADPELRKRKIAARRRWERRNPEKHRAALLRNRDLRNAAHRRRREKDGWARDRAYAAAHRAQIKASMARWYAVNAVHVRARARAWQLAHPDYHCATEARRRARKSGNGGSHTLAEWKELCRRTGDCCVYCDEPKRLERDHAIPLSRGGSDNISNILPACRSCNAKKHTRTAEEFVFHR